MKKILVLLILVFTFSTTFSKTFYKDEAKSIEKLFSNKYQTSKVGDVKLEKLEFKVKFYTNSALLEIQIESFRGDGNWSKLSDKEVELFLNKLADEIRNSINNQALPINIIVKIENVLKDDEVVVNKLY